MQLHRRYSGCVEYLVAAAGPGAPCSCSNVKSYAQPVLANNANCALCVLAILYMYIYIYIYIYSVSPY